jgi:hypothetical protein
MFKTRTIAGPLGGAVCVALVVGAFALTLGGARSAEPAVALPAPALGEAADLAAAQEKQLSDGLVQPCLICHGLSWARTVLA